MILEWSKREFTKHEQLLGTIFDAGMITRADLMLLTGWNSRTLSRQMKRVRSKSEDMVRKYMTPRRTAAYALGEDGVRYMHQMLGIQSRIVTMESQMNHTLGLNAILMRYLRSHGREKVQWFSTREATDELHWLRSREGMSDEQIRKTQIRPDALLYCSKEKFWLEFDNSTEGSRQLFNKYRLYVTNLEHLPESLRTVVWVTKSEVRRRWMQQWWERLAVTSIRMLFFVEGEETAFWPVT